ncbi:MAG: response regulator transcription factor [Hydrogenophaga sp.]|jgi:two-component system, NarL family, invasion response regulator UvrY|uniref:response regulator transcription factor n=1 Tax=Hydrogenophaga sp. TaxID=1904254 RepID=UPI002AB852AA|nr:response regulator transcription factor [Hydrogenophaga sp.]MDZ4102737.1 response regulator transcription factor [Hydrogenophaga sp.]
MSDIYLIDDHAMVRDGLRAVLEDAGHHVVGESDQPTQALSDVLRLSPGVVLLDLHLGQRSGFEVLEQLHKRKSTARTIVLTMSAQPRHVAEALRLGASGYVLKGSPASEVLKAVEAVASGRKHLGPEVAQLAIEVMTQDAAPTPIEALSGRERQVIQLVVRGLTSVAISEQLHLSRKTVESYRSRIMAKLDVHDVPALVRLAIREGLISADDI